MRPPSLVQIELLALVDAFIRANGFPPSARDMASARNRGVRAITEGLDRLARHGLIEKAPNQHRAISLTDAGRALLDGGNTNAPAGFSPRRSERSE